MLFCIRSVYWYANAPVKKKHDCGSFEYGHGIAKYSVILGLDFNNVRKSLLVL